MCVNFIREWRDLKFNVDSEQQIFKKLFTAKFIYSQSFCQKSAEGGKSSKKYFHIFVLMSDLGFKLGPYEHTTYYTRRLFCIGISNRNSNWNSNRSRNRKEKTKSVVIEVALGEGLSSGIGIGITTTDSNQKISNK